VILALESIHTVIKRHYDGTVNSKYARLFCIMGMNYKKSIIDVSVRAYFEAINFA